MCDSLVNITISSDIVLFNGPFYVFSIIYRSESYKRISIFYTCFRDEEKPKNPMVELFYGRFLAVGVLEGIVACLLLLPQDAALRWLF